MSEILHIKGNKKGIGLGTTATVDSKIKLGWKLKLNGNKINGLVDLVYPVGSIYTSTVATSPATLFGGTWEQITDKFLIAANSTYTAGSTGGAATVALTTANLPSHNHSLSLSLGSNGAHIHTISESAAEAGTHSHVQSTNTIVNVKGQGYSKSSGYYATSDKSYSTQDAGAHTHTTSGSTSESTTHSHTVSGNTNATGSGTAHNNMPPYVAVYMWKRTK